MKIEVQLFAQARELVGRGSVSVELDDGATVAELRTGLATAFPAIKPISQSLLVAVGNDYASDATSLESGSRVACFPPVSGG